MMNSTFKQTIIKMLSIIITIAVVLGVTSVANASYNHFAGPFKQSPNGDLNTVSKYEQQVDLEAGEHKTVTISCGFNEYVTDGSGRVDHVDQDTGHLSDVKIVESYANSSSSYRVSFVNNAHGRAQAKVFIVCVKRQTMNNNYHHAFAAPVNTDKNWNIGYRYVTLTCPSGYVPITPGYEIQNGSAYFVYSEPVGHNKWRFGFDVTSHNTDIRVSVRCLRVDLTSHESLVFKHRIEYVSVPPFSVKKYVVSCGQKAKGIVATFDLGEHGLKILGHDPQPKSRVFTIYNPTHNHLPATLDLICLSDRTGRY